MTGALCLETERLRLRPFAPADEPALLALFRDDGVRRYLLDGMLVDAAWVRNEIAASAARFAAGRQGLFLAQLAGTDGGVVGFAGFRPDHEPPVLELMYGFLPAWWGRGLATEAARAVLAWGFGPGGLTAVEAAVDVPNADSLRVLRKLGFVEVRRSAGAFGDMLHLALARPA